MDNNERAELAARAVAAFGAGAYACAEDIAVQIGDLLADLRHYLDALGLGAAVLDDLCEGSREVYNEEVEEDGKARQSQSKG